MENGGNHGGDHATEPRVSTVTVSLSGNAGESPPAHVQLPATAATVAQANLRSRPCMAEPEVREPTPKPALADPPGNLLERYKTRLNLAPRSGTDSLSASPVSMSLGALVDMAVQPDFQTACKLMHGFLTKAEGGETPSVACTSPAPAVEAAKAPAVASYRTVTAQPVTAGANAPVVGTVVNANLCPAVSSVSQQKCAIVETYSVSMPYIMGKLDGGRLGSISRQMYLDQGSNLNLISQSAYNRDFPFIKQARGTNVKLEPLRLNMYNSQHSDVTQMVQGLTMQIGCAEYTIDMLIVPDTKFEYLLGANFMAAFAVKPLFHRNKAELGCPKGPNNQRVPSYQAFPMYFRGSNLKLAVKGPRPYVSS